MRLKNLRIDEVSLVDKAANRRKFAIVKRDTSKEDYETLVTLGHIALGLTELRAVLAKL